MVKFIPTKTTITTQALSYRFVDELFHFYELLMGIVHSFRFLNIDPKNQSGAVEAWWAHNPQVPGSKPSKTNYKNGEVYSYQNDNNNSSIALSIS